MILSISELYTDEEGENCNYDTNKEIRRVALVRKTNVFFTLFKVLKDSMHLLIKSHNRNDN